MASYVVGKFENNRRRTGYRVELVKLFDDTERSDFDDPRPGESAFDYFNRSALPGESQIRKLLESWFSKVDHTSQKDIRARFRRPEETAHEGALFELLLHELLTNLGFTLTLHPEIEGSRNRPDFLVRIGSQRFYLEATVVGDRSGPFTRSANEQDVINKLNSLTSNEFYLGVHMEGELSRTLGKNYVTRPFNELLKSHTREEVQRMIEEGGMYAAPSRKVEYGDWTLEGWLSPVSSESKRRNAYHEIVIEPFRASRTDSASSVKNALLVKGDRYGELDGPMVVAVNPRDEFYSYHNSDMDVLFGTKQLVYSTQSSDSQPQLVRKSDGVWPRRNSLDAVMRFMKVDLWNITRATTCLYVNPYKSDIELPRELFRLPHAEGQDGVISWADGEEITRLLGLPSG